MIRREALVSQGSHCYFGLPLKHGELAAQHAQLNPHFLFNTLNSLLGLMDQNSEDAKTALTQLADSSAHKF